MSFMMFMRLLDQPKPGHFTASAQRGRQIFEDIGFDGCHTPIMRTKAGDLGTFVPQLRDVDVDLFSDVLLHNTGARLADNVIQGNAGPDMFRTRRCGASASACSSSTTAARILLTMRSCSTTPLRRWPMVGTRRTSRPRRIRSS
jgi:hypothetical protein